MTTLFTLEMIIKIVALGFIANGKPSYIRDWWNALDFLIVFSAILSIAIHDKNLAVLKGLRMLRILRPLRLISRNKGLKISIISLFYSIPQILNLLLIVCFFIFLLSILGTTLFKGKFYRCATEHLDISYEHILDNIQSKEDCWNHGGEWVNPDLNFDTVQNSFLTLLCIQSTEGWIDVMWDSVDAVGIDQMPLVDNHRGYILLFITIIITLCLLFFNLFVGVVIERFNREKDKLSMNHLLTQVEHKFIMVQIMAYSAQPVVRIQECK